jgi:hypothetical protein
MERSRISNEQSCEVVDWIELARGRVAMAASYEHSSQA